MFGLKPLSKHRRKPFERLSTETHPGWCVRHITQMTAEQEGQDPILNIYGADGTACTEGVGPHCAGRGHYLRGSSIAMTWRAMLAPPF